MRGETAQVWDSRPTRETLRKLVHIAFGFLAFAAAFLGPGRTAVVILAALVFNAAVLPRIGGRRLWREAEKVRGFSVGMLSYPASVLVLVLIFWRRPEIAAAAWGVLAFGDGMATLMGSAFGRSRLPWNPKKSWVGTISHGVFGAVAATLLLGWTLTRQAAAVEISWPFLALIGSAAALFSAFLESQPQELDDNVGVPLLTGLFLFGLSATEGYWTAELDPYAFLHAVVSGLVANLVLGALAYKARSIDVSGAVAGTVLGTVIYAFLGWRGFLLLVAFFVLGSAATRLGHEEKVAHRLAQDAGGRRSARHAVANAGVPALLAFFAAATPYGSLLLPAFAAAFASAASDTLESEIGQLKGGRTVLITTFERVPRGTDGAVSLAGTLAGLAGSAVIALLGWAVGLYAPGGILVVAVAGFLGSVADSLAGATLERRGLLDNEAVNVMCTLAGALVAVGLGALP